MNRSGLVWTLSMSLAALTAHAARAQEADHGLAVWAEGGGFLTSGPYSRFGQSRSATRRDTGGEGALGVGYRASGSVWRLIGDFRYGATRGSGAYSASGTYQGSPVTGEGRWNSQEDRWLADFAVGRDVAIGQASVELDGGLRISEISESISTRAGFIAPCSSGGTVTGSGSGGSIYIDPAGGPPPGADSPGSPTPHHGACGSGGATTPFSVHLGERYLGAGPRVGLGGDLPIGAGFHLQAHAGVAALLGERSLRTTTTGAAGAFNLAKGKLESGAVVWNTDAELAVSRALTSHIRASLGYRFEGYWSVLETLGTAGRPASDDRRYLGPVLRLSVLMP